MQFNVEHFWSNSKLRLSMTSTIQARCDPDERDIRFGHDLNRLQDENGLDLSLLRENLALSVEERLLALEDYIQCADSVGPAGDS